MIQQLLHTSTKNGGQFHSLVLNQQKTFGTRSKSRIFGLLYPMYLRLKTADLKSRLFYDKKEWSLNESVAKSLFDKFGKPETDLFTSHMNTKCTKYGSYKPEPDACHVNAFSLCWLNLNFYIFPPFVALVVVPCWETQQWFTQFVRLVKPGTTPLLIPAHQHLLQLQAAK